MPTFAQSADSTAGAARDPRIGVTSAGAILSPRDGLPMWLRTAIGLAYFAVGTAHVLLGLMAWHWDKWLLSSCVVVLAIINISTLEIWRARLQAWWQQSPSYRGL